MATRDLPPIVGEEQFRAACAELGRRIRAGESATADEYLPRLRDTSPDVALELIYTEYVVREDVGRPLSRAEWTERYPAYQERFERLLAIHCTLRDGNGADEPGKTLGDFRLIREIGRGGMGVVYEAEQISLGRRVALKILPFAATLDPRQLQRFKTEAQAAAHLHHTHIVPVHFVGCERGVHYYAMQLIEGRTLAQVIRDLGRPAASVSDPNATVSPSEATLKQPFPIAPIPQATSAGGTSNSLVTRQHFRTVAEWGVQAAEALDHAHEQGIVHRDVKPANFLIDARGHVWITDFGLAMCQTEANLTMTGDLIGTLRYMSPEQTLARRIPVDHRTDVYSLSATLYELLTLHPVCDGRDRAEIFQQITLDEPRPLRKWNRLVPQELETIILKALEKRAENRYATAKDFAEDLRRWLSDEPIKARRPTLLLRARKWARRHQPVVWSATAALVAILAVLAGSIGWAARDRALRRSDTERRSDAFLQDALRLRDAKNWPASRIMAQRAESLFAPGDEHADFRERLRSLLIDLDMVDRLERIRLDQGIAKPEGWDRSDADPYYLAAFRDYGVDVVDLDAGIAAERLCASPIREELVAAVDDWMFTLPAKEEMRRNKLRMVAAGADHDEWRNRFRDPMVLRDRIGLEELARRPEVATLPPATAALLGQALRQAGAVPKAIEVLAAAQRKHPADFWLNMRLANILRFSTHPPRYEEAAGYCRAGLAIRPNSVGIFLGLGSCFETDAQIDEAIATFRRAIEIDPNYPHSWLKLGEAQAFKGIWRQAITAYEQCLRLRPERLLAARAHYDLGRAYECIPAAEKAIAEYKEAVRLNPKSGAAHHCLAHALCLCADSKLRDPDLALDSATKALALAPTDPDRWRNLGTARYRSGDWDGALAALEKANEGFSPANPYVFVVMAMAHWRKGDSELAHIWYDRTVRCLEERRAWLDRLPLVKLEILRLRAEAAELLGIESSVAPRVADVTPKKL